MTSYQPVTHVIFDMDGLLLDTEKLYTEAIQEMCNPFNKQYTWELKVQLMGHAGIESARTIIEALQLPYSPEEYLVKVQEVYERLFPSAKLLPDTENLYMEATQQIAARYNKEYTWDLKLKIMGRTTEEISHMLTEELQLPLSPEQYNVEKMQLHKEMLPNCRLFPGVERLVTHLHKTGIPIAVATSSSKDSFDLKVQNHREFFTHFDPIVMGSSDPEVKRGKPHPDIFEVCVKRFSDVPQAEKCLVFEDSPNGVQAARSAGMQVVMVPDPRMDAQLMEGATLVLGSLEDFKPELFGLPPF